MISSRYGHMQERLIGVDEAGRGSLAGPLYAAAVVLPEEFDTRGVRDSKVLTAAQREAAADRIHAEAFVGIGVASVEMIEMYNVLQATMLAMHEAIDSVLKACNLPTHSSHQYRIIVDGNYFRSTEFVSNVETIIRGDSLISCIAAASIVAKVARDRYMTQEAHRLYPEYNFAQHKGYGTAQHREAIRHYGACPLHRALFLRKIIP